MARLASKSNYQNILDGDHTALGLSYNTDLHSGIELRRTSHKAAEQKRRDSLKHCFEDLRQMIPNIVDKAPSKVYLLKKSFDYICHLKAELAQKHLELAQCRVQETHHTLQLDQWFLDLEQALGSDLEFETARISREIAEMSAAAVEMVRVGNQPSPKEKDKEKTKGGGNKPSPLGGRGGSGKAKGSAGGSSNSTHDSGGQGVEDTIAEEESLDEDEDEDEDDNEKVKRPLSGRKSNDSGVSESSGAHSVQSGSDRDSSRIPATLSAAGKKKKPLLSHNRTRSRSMKSVGSQGEGEDMVLDGEVDEEMEEAEDDDGEYDD
ncbi:hypothetical protein BGW38_009123, partial [Lunasporangiospora selenospora]